MWKVSLVIVLAGVLALVALLMGYNAPPATQAEAPQAEQAKDDTPWGLIFVGVVVLGVVAVPALRGAAYSGTASRAGYQHPTARAEGNSVYVDGNINELQRQSHYVMGYGMGIGGKEWVHLGYKRWRIDLPKEYGITAEEVARRINRNSADL